MARYYTPNGRSIQGQGITPNVVVDATAPPARSRRTRELPRERDLRKRLRNEQGDKAGRRSKRLDDYQLQMALDYLHVVVGVLAAGRRSK